MGTSKACRATAWLAPWRISGPKVGHGQTGLQDSLGGSREFLTFLA